MPLSLLGIGESQVIKKVKGKDETRQFLATLGFVEGETVSVISQLSGNMILSIKDTRVALDKQLANRILV